MEEVAQRLSDLEVVMSSRNSITQPLESSYTTSLVVYWQGLACLSPAVATWYLCDQAYSLLCLLGIPALPYSVLQQAQSSFFIN